jgi:phosphatidylserine/phosphatidylglycerophosphate/cardiolipin synthase-like enzyme
MKLQIHRTFLADLRSAEDAHFARRVLSKVLDADGNFINDGDDHRYHGVTDAWIRYVSRGATAYRVIYIRSGETVALYRAGGHSVEDRLKAPRSDIPTIEAVAAQPELAEFRAGAPSVVSADDFGEFLYTSTPLQLKQFIVSLGQVSHREIWLVSPFVNTAMFAPMHAFGRLIFKAREDGAAIGLITRPPTSKKELEMYELLEREDITVAFVERLHAKLYIFDIADEERYRMRRQRHSVAIIGSANLTDAAMALDDRPGNEELCYRIPNSRFGAARQYVAFLEKMSKDTRSFKRVLVQ